MNDKLERAKQGFEQIESSQLAIIHQLDLLELQIDEMVGVNDSLNEGLGGDQDVNKQCNTDDFTKDKNYWNMINVSREMHKCD